MIKNHQISDYGVIVKMHLTILPNSIPALLGYSYLKKVYKYFQLSKYEKIIIIDNEKDFSGLSVYSLRPDTLSKRLIFNTPLISSIIKFIFTQSIFKSFKLLRLFIVNGTNVFPELLYLFVDENHRGSGIGSRLVKETLKVSVEKNDEYLSVRCEDNLVNFYTKLGFELYEKNKYNILIKKHSIKPSGEN